MRSTADLIFLSRDFVRTLTGSDYFRQPQPLGLYFTDQRGYYNDFRGKADWDGPKENGVPSLLIPQLQKRVVLPVMVLQYGLGSLDRYFSNNDTKYLSGVRAVSDWILHNINDKGFFNSPIPVLHPTKKHFSSNSAMAQGEALSFIHRVASCDLHPERQRLLAAAHQIAANLIQPIELEGGLLRRGSDTFLCEICTEEPPIVLNGWIYAIFGLIDHVRATMDPEIGAAMTATIDTLTRRIDCYILPDGWSLYDDQGRLASPFYHRVHGALVQALARLTENSTLSEAALCLTNSDTRWNRIKYTGRKIREKLSDKGLHATA